ncbi:MAG: HD-GYP domain-containing protein [Anaerolineales bacterium]
MMTALYRYGRKLKKSLRKGLTSPNPNHWRDSVFFFTLLAILILGLFAIVPSGWLSIQAGDYAVVVFDLIAYAAVLCLFVYRRRIPYKIRAWALVAVIAVAAWVLLFVIPSDQVAALFWLFLVPPLAGILHGVGWGLSLWAVNVGVIVTLTYMVYVGSPLVPDFLQIGYKTWLTHSISFLATNALITVPLSILLYDIETAISSLQKKTEELQLAYDATIEGWAQALSLRDDETVGHSRRVTENVVRFGMVYGLGQKELTDLRRGALLHDIGKMGIPDNILYKTGTHDEQEMKIVKKHPGFAKEMLDQIDYLSGALDVPLYHHEKWNGTGYPEGLSGKEIPLSARLFAIIDVWDALTSNRPYRKALLREETVRYMRDQSGVHFDPELLGLFLEMIENGELFAGEQLEKANVVESHNGFRHQYSSERARLG